MSYFRRIRVQIAIIGSGISGMVTARLLHREHDITVFEANSYVGGHCNTVPVAIDGEQHNIDTGFIVYNDRTYPQFSQILSDLNVATSPTSMSFSVRCDRTGLEYNGTNLNGVFTQRRNLLRPSFLRMLRDILRFNREGAIDAERVSADQTVGEYLLQKRYSSEFADQYLLPMGAAIWSCPCSNFAAFPIRFILDFYVHHGLLSLRDRPAWRIVDGGSQTYVSRLVQPFRDRIRLRCPVRQVSRLADGVVVRHADGEDTFDEVIFACHSDQAIRMLNDADRLETELLSAFPYSLNTAVLHTDETILPRQQRAWASWNYHITDQETMRPALTYNMNILQQIKSSKTFCVTLNEDDSINPDKVLARFSYSHPVFTTRRADVQQRHNEVIRHRRTSFCGAYWRNGFHEDGVVSALAVCARFGIPGWTPDTNRTRTKLAVPPTTVSGQA
jgi:predicted NAD/FAD-binding protein